MINNNPALEPHFALTGVTADFSHLLEFGFTVANPNLNGNQLNLVLKQIFGYLNHTKKKGISFWSELEDYIATAGDSDLVRVDNIIYVAIQASSVALPKNPKTNPDFWRVIIDLDAGITDNLTNNSSTSPLSANQGLILKGYIDTINALLTSDDVNLDELQEIVNYIKLNKATLDVDTNQTGDIVTRPVNSVSTGLLECDGTLLSRTSYPELFAVIGETYGVGDGATTFAIPDLRGEFIRGFDNGRGADSGRVIGSAQAGANAEHKHTNPAHTHYSFVGGSVTGGSSISSSTSPVSNLYSLGDKDYLMISSVSTPNVGRTSSSSLDTNLEGVLDDNRPRNISMMYCIKY